MEDTFQHTTSLVPIRNYIALKRASSSAIRSLGLIPIRNYIALKQINHVFLLAHSLVPIRNYIALKREDCARYAGKWFSTYTKLHRSKTSFGVYFLIVKFSTYTKLHRSKTSFGVYFLIVKFSTYTKLHRSKTSNRGASGGSVTSGNSI